MALFLLAFSGVLLLVYPDGWAHRGVLAIGAVMVVLIVWHVREYYHEAKRQLEHRRIRRMYR
jgi:hypothetical protein